MTLPGVKLRARGENLLIVLATGLFAAGLCFVRPTVFESLDYVQYWRPTLQFLADTVRAGTIPLWNPYIGLGRPFLADMQNAVFYPPAYLICAGQELGVFLLLWLHFLLAILGMRRLGGALGTGRWQSYLHGGQLSGLGRTDGALDDRPDHLLLGTLLCAVAVLLRSAHRGAVADPAGRSICDVACAAVLVRPPASVLVLRDRPGGVHLRSARCGSRWAQRSGMLRGAWASLARRVPGAAGWWRPYCCPCSN